jgi:hypothetical protein
MGSNNLVLAALPDKLKIYIGPATVRADNSTYECVFVQLLDTKSQPARATNDTVITLSSSRADIGVVDSTVTISKNTTYAVAKFTSTFTPGTTIITASATGYATVQADLDTAAPVPYKLAVFGFPPVLPTDGLTHNAVVVQLQDSGGTPARAPLGGLTVILTSSNTSVATIVDSAIISGGQTYTIADITTTYDFGSAVITAQASGYFSATTTFTTQPPGNSPKTLRIYVAPPKTLADNTTNFQIAIEFLNETGNGIARPPTDVTIQLSSSTEKVGIVQPILVNPAGWAYSKAAFTTTFSVGQTTITAAATDLITDTEVLTTSEIVPTKLAVYCSPSVLPADNVAYNVIQVQLQDAGGNPAKDPNGDVIVSMFSSEPTVGTAPTTLTIPYGKTYATTTFKSEYITGTTSITAQASGYATGQATMKTYLIENFSLIATVTSDPTIVIPGNQTIITAYVTNQFGTPAKDVTVKFTSSAGGIFTTVSSVVAGYYTATFTAPYQYPMKNITITANATRPGWTNTTANMKLTINPVTCTIQILVQNETGTPIADANITTLLKPSVMTNLTGLTNSSGYVTFTGAAEGNYTFQVSKVGYLLTNMTFIFKSDSPAQIVSLIAAPSQPPAIPLMWILLIVAIAIIAIAIILMWRYGLLEKILGRTKQPSEDKSTSEKTPATSEEKSTQETTTATSEEKSTQETTTDLNSN